MRAEIGLLGEAFNGHFDAHHAFLLTRMLGRVDAITTDIAALDAHFRGAADPSWLSGGPPMMRSQALARALGDAAVMAATTDSFLGARYRRIAKRRGKKRAIVTASRGTGLRHRPRRVGRHATTWKVRRWPPTDQRYRHSEFDYSVGFTQVRVRRSVPP
jgi:hypothetical protein